MSNLLKMSGSRAFLYGFSLQLHDVLAVDIIEQAALNVRLYNKACMAEKFRVAW